MRVARDLRHVLRIKRRRGFFRKPARPGHLYPVRDQKYIPAGGIISAPRGTRNFVVNLVKKEIEDKTYVNDFRLNEALDKLISRLF